MPAIHGAVRLALPFVALALGACVTATQPADLRVPAQLTCFDLKEPLTYTVEQGLLKIVWTTRFERGPYVAEREDDGGTYFRAPPGGLRIARPDMLDRPEGIGSHRTYDGGVWLPKDPQAAPRYYTYFTNAPAPVQVPEATASCATVGVVRDPQTQAVSTLAYALGGSTAGAADGAAARASGGAPGMSYGQAAATGAAGGAIGGLIVSALINMDIGKILHSQDLEDAPFVARLREAAMAIVPVQNVR